MNCPKCDVRMIPVRRVECLTGDAQHHRYPKCCAMFYEQLTVPDVHFYPPRREINHKLAFA